MAVEESVGKSGLNRRRFLQSGSLGCAALAASPVLAGPAAAATARSASPRLRSVVLIWLEGGASPYETFAPQSARAGSAGLFGFIPSAADGAPVSALMPRMAAWMEHAFLLRAVHHTEGSHEAAAHLALTGYLRHPERAFPTVGETVAYRLGAPAGSAEVLANGPSDAAGDAAPHLAYAEAPPAQARLVAAPSSPPARGDRRRALLTRLGAPVAERSARVREERGRHYGRSAFGRACLAARQQVEAGTLFVQVTLSGWDRHADLAGTYRSLVPQLDQGFSALLADLQDRGLLEETLVLCMSEFGRSPRVNAQGGRDHWPYAGCAVLVGGGVPGGRVVGELDAEGYPRSGAVTPGEVLGEIYARLGDETAQV